MWSDPTEKQYYTKVWRHGGKIGWGIQIDVPYSITHLHVYLSCYSPKAIYIFRPASLLFPFSFLFVSSPNPKT